MEVLTNVMQDQNRSKYERAQQRVERIKKFYTHLRAYIIINFMLLVLRFFIIPLVSDAPFEIGFERWLTWNALFTPFLWGIGLLLHGVFVFHDKFNFLKKWEERKIKEYMNKEDQKNKEE